VAVVAAQSLVASVLVPVAVAAAGAVAATAVSIVSTRTPAQASISGSALILSTSVNGGSSSAEAQAASALGLSVTVATPSAWDSMTQSQFAAYTVIIIGDPSSSTTCSTSAPSDALSTAQTWGPAVSGNVVVLGTAPALGGATTLISDGIAYAASGGSGKAGLYVSLNCEDSSAAANTNVPLLAGVDGGEFSVTGQGSNCPSDAGTVNTWEALSLTQFNGLKSAKLGPWASPACSVEETLNSWPTGLGGLGYYAGASPATFTASDGATGQAYIVAGAPVPDATAHLVTSFGGEIPVGTVSAGGSNQAAPGVNQPSAGGVNTEDGDFTQSATDLSIPTYGPSLDFTRSYDAQTAQQQTQTGTPGAMGYGWTDNWASSLSQASPVPGDIYLMDGRRDDNGNGGAPGSAPLDSPGTVYYNGGNVYIVDTAGNRIQEIPGTTGTQWSLSMTAGDEYTVAGNNAGGAGMSSDGVKATSGWLRSPGGMAIDSAGNMYIADTGNCRVIEIPAASGTQWGISMTANDQYTIAGRGGTSNCSIGGDNKVATQSNLNAPSQVAVDRAGDVYIADTANSRIQEAFASGGAQWGQSMTATYVYTVAGSSSGTAGFSGTGGAATSALLSSPEGVAVSAAGNLYIADTANCRIAEVPPASGNQWGQSMTLDDIYTVAGRGGSSNCTIGGDGKVATSSNLNAPSQVETGAASSEDLYIADTSNNRIQEVVRSGATEWGQSMTATYVYTVAGSSSGTSGYSGNGGAATSATMNAPQSASVSSTTLYTADTGNNRVRQVNSSGTISAYAGNGYTLAQTGNGGAAIDAGLATPEGEVFDAAGDVFIADSANNRIQEIVATTHSQFGISMTAGDVYTIAGNAQGASGSSGDGGKATSGYLNSPESIASDSAGNLYIADTNNCRIQKVNTSGTMSTVAGSSAGTCGLGSDGGAATSSDLNGPEGVSLDAQGDIYIADTLNNRIQEVFTSGGQAFGQSMTAGDVYTIAGSSAGTSGHSGDSGKATSALLYYPCAMGIDGAGNLYIADYTNNRIQEVPVKTATMRGQSMTKYYMYTVAGNASGTSGISGDGGKATSAYLDDPGNATVDAAGNIYITDGANNRVQEVAVANGTQWGQAMAANHIYTVAGSATGTSGNSGDGSPATSALMNIAENIALDKYGDLYVTDHTNNHLREVTSATSPTITPAPGLTSALYPAPGGITINQADGSQVTFYAKSGGACASPYVVAGQYCALPENVGASLTYSSSAGTYTFSPQPGTGDTYNTGGNLTAVSDAASNALTLAYGTTAPGSGNCPSSANWCQTITAASKRVLTVGYNSSNLLTSVTDPLGRQWAYAYNSSSDLTSVTDPMGRVTSYSYGTDPSGNPLNANNLLTITNPNGQTGGPDAGAHTTVVYDSTGNVTSETDPMGYVTTYTWNVNPSTGDGADTVTDPDGNQTVYDYTQGELAAESAWTGSTLTSEQDFVPDQSATSGDNSAGTQLNTATADGDGNITTYTYDASGNPLTTTAPDSISNQTATTTQQYTSLNEANCSSDDMATSTCSTSAGPSTVTPGGVITPPSSAPPEGLTWTLYDTDGNELYQTTGVYQPGASSASYLQTTYSLYKGNSVTLSGTTISCTATPPSASLPCATINADGVVTQLAYNSAGNLISSSPPDGNGSEVATTTYVYDGDGEQITTISPDGNLTGANAGNYTTTTAYNGDGQRTSVTQAGGSGATVTPRATGYGYDSDGNQITLQDARGYTTMTAYNADDQSTLVTDPDGNATLTCYDGVGNTAQTVPASGVAANSLTPASCPSSYPSGYGNRLASDATTFTYDASGNKTAMTSPAPAGQSGSETTTYAYDGAGNLTKTTAPPTSNGGSNQVTTNSYNAAHQLVSDTTGYGTSAASTVSYCYNPNGHQTSVVYADGNTSGVATCETASPWVVSANADPTHAAYQTTSSYDSAGELVSTTAPVTAAAPSGATTACTYDAAGNMLTRTDPNGVTTTWTYSPLNKTATVSYSGSSAHSLSYTYDANGRKTGMSDATGSTSYVYDPFGELTSATNGANQVTGYGYNADGSTTSITYPLPTTATWATTSTVAYGYDHADMLNSVTDFNGNQITIGNTADGLPNSAALGSTGDTISTTYDNTDAASAIALKNGITTLQSFAYSDAPAGNVLSEADTPSSPQSPMSYTYDSKGRVTSMTPGTGSTLNYGFDASSNLTTTPTGASASYDNAGELTSSTLSGTTTNYTFNADGQRLSAKQGSSTVAYGSWNGAGQLTAYSNTVANMSAAAYDGNGTRASTTTIPAGKSAITLGYVWNTTTQVPLMIMDSSMAYIYGTGLTPAEQVNLSTGTVTYLVTDQLGSVRSTVNSSGSVTGTTNYDAWGNPETTGGLTATTPFGFAGGYTDPTGLIYLINRYYDPQTGQFISVDPLLSQTLAPYSYASGNPISNTDPTGEAHWRWWEAWWVPLGLYLNRHETLTLSLVLVGLATPSALVLIHYLPSWARDILLWFIHHNWEGIWDATNEAMDHNECVHLRFTIWGNVFGTGYRGSWCTGTYPWN
jgi:RHS repeat-associated protein